MDNTTRRDPSQFELTAQVTTVQVTTVEGTTIQGTTIQETTTQGRGRGRERGRERGRGRGRGSGSRGGKISATAANTAAITSLIQTVAAIAERITLPTTTRDEEFIDIDTLAVTDVVNLTHEPPTPQKGSAAKKRR
jgi:ribosomal protein L19E